jgi:hypothetical protein
MSKKQSCVEWLQATELERDLTLGDWNKAKEMYNDQLKKLLKIIDWYDNHGDVRPNNETYSWFIELWNETFGGQDNE